MLANCRLVSPSCCVITGASTEIVSRSMKLISVARKIRPTIHQRKPRILKVTAGAISFTLSASRILNNDFSVKLRASPCLCGEITKKEIHHRGTEIAQRTTEKNFLEQHLQPKLQHARIVSLRQRAKVRGAEIRYQRPEVRMIKQIEDLAAQLQPEFLTQLNLLHQRQIEILRAGHLDQVARHRADQSGAGRKRSAIDPTAAEVIPARVK